MSPRFALLNALVALTMVSFTTTAAAQDIRSDAAKCRLAVANGARKVNDLALNKMIACEKQRMRGTIAATVDCSNVHDAGFPSMYATQLAARASAEAQKIVAGCSANTPAALGYIACASPCDTQVPTINSFSDVSACLACNAEAAASKAIVAAYGATPPVGESTQTWRCQNTDVGNAVRVYAKTRLSSQRSCQYDVDLGVVAATDCKTADLTGKIAGARTKASTKIAHCADTDLASLTSCATTAAAEETCAPAAADTMTNSLFDEIYPQLPATPTPTVTLTRTVTKTPTFTGTPTATAAAGSCQSANFLDVSGAAGPGGSYSSLHPSLSASCGSSTVTVQSNGIPTYEYLALTPNGLQAKSYTFSFPRYPSAAASTTDVPLLGNIGVAVDGIPIYGVNEGPQPASDAYGDPIAAAILDGCGSHSAQQGTFHNHVLQVKCLLQSAVSESEPWNDDDPSPDQASPIVGYAFDGFPIYGPYDCTDSSCTAVQEMLSSWDNTGYQAGTVGCTSSSACSNGYCTNVMIGGAQTTACVPRTCVWSNNTYTAKSGSQYLDQCNGHVGPKGDYHYHTTTTFPYILGCYRGTPTNNGGSGTPPGGTCP